MGSGINSSESTKIRNSYIKITSPRSVEAYTQGGDFCGTETNYKIFFLHPLSHPLKNNLKKHMHIYHLLED